MKKQIWVSKNLEILNAKENVKITNKIDDYLIFSEDITYYKNKELVIGKNGFKAIDQDTEIEGNKFEYQKNLEILNAKENVKITNKIDDYLIFSEDITYYKNKELVIGKNGFKAIDQDTEIEGNKFEYQKNLEILNAKENVKITNKIDDYLIFSEDITYYKNEERIFSKNKTQAKSIQIYI